MFRATRLAATGAAILAAVSAAAVPAVSADGRGGRQQDVRLNEIQVVGSHNSYHRELSDVEKATQLRLTPGARDLFYSHARLGDQLQYQEVRSFELDVFPDPEGGLYADPLVRRIAGLPPLNEPVLARPGVKVLHVADLDYNSTCLTLVLCLREVDAWSDANPGHVPITIMLEFKQSEDALERAGGAQSPPWDEARLDELDAEIRSVFGENEILTPDDVRRRGRTLEQSILSSGWPKLAQARGQVMFLMDNDPGPVRDAYRSGRPNLEGRVLFTNSRVGQPDAAFIKRNEPRGANLAQIQALVRLGYLIRTRSDVPLATIDTGDTEQRAAALASGAQIVSTDFPEVGMAARYDSDFFVELPGEVPARCNPVNAPRRCHDDALERLRRR